MNTQPEALRLAAALESLYSKTVASQQAARELRRLHKEVEWMKHNMSNVSRVEQSLIAANERLHAVNTELLEALNAMLTHMGMDEDEWTKPTFDQARAAITKATGEQA